MHCIRGLNRKKPNSSIHDTWSGAQTLSGFSRRDVGVLEMEDLKYFRNYYQFIHLYKPHKGINRTRNCQTIREIGYAHQMRTYYWISSCNTNWPLVDHPEVLRSNPETIFVLSHNCKLLKAEMRYWCSSNYLLHVCGRNKLINAVTDGVSSNVTGRTLWCTAADGTSNTCAVLYMYVLV